MIEQKPASIFVDRAISVALRNNTIRITLGLERSADLVDERIELIMPMSTCAATFESLLAAVRGLREAATGAKPSAITDTSVVGQPTSKEPQS